MEFFCLIILQFFAEKTVKHQETDWIGIFLNFVAILFSIYPYFVLFVGVYFGLDPISVLIHRCLGVEPLSVYLPPWGVFIIYIIRCIIISPAVFMTCQDIARTVIMGKIAMDLVANTSSRLKASCKEIAWQRRYVDNLLQIRMQLEIVLLLFYDIFSNTGTVLMGFLTTTAFNYVSLRLHHVIPMPMYLWFPSVSIMLPVVINVLLLMMINVYEGSVKVQNGWLREARNSRDLKYLTKRLEGVRPLRIFVGVGGINFYFFKQSTKVTFYSAIIDCTINALLST